MTVDWWVMPTKYIHTYLHIHVPISKVKLLYYLIPSADSSFSLTRLSLGSESSRCRVGGLG